MPEPFDKALQAVLQRARTVADAGGVIEPIHLLYSLLVEAPQVWEKLSNVDPAAIKAALPQFNAPPLGARSMDAILANSSKRVIAYSMEECMRAGQAPQRTEWVAPEYMLFRLLRESGSDAAHLLRSHGLTIEELRKTFAKARGLSRIWFTYHD